MQNPTDTSQKAAQPSEPSLSIDQIHEKLINTILMAFTAIGLPTLAAGLYRAKDVGWHNLMYVQIALTVLLLATTIFYRKLSSNFKSAILLICFWVLGIGALYTWGLIGMGIFFLTITAILATIFFGSITGMLILVCSAIFMVAIAIGIATGKISLNFDIEKYATTSSNWTATIGAMITLTTIMILCIGRYNRTLRNLLHKTSQQATKLTRANAMIAESEMKYRLLFETANDAIVLIEDGKFVDCNSKTLTTLGYKDKEQLIGLSPLDISPQFQSDGSESSQLLQAKLSKAINGEPQLFYWQHIGKDGQLLDVDVSLTKVVLEGKTYLLAIGRDITQQMKTQRQRDNLLKTLSQKNKDLESIIYVSSHDLRSPLINLKGFSDELAQSCGEIEQLLKSPEFTNSDKQKIISIMKDNISVQLNYICANTDKIDRLQNGLLKICRLGREIVAISQINMNELIETIQNKMMPEINNSNAEIEITPLPDCMGDNTKLIPVFTNILDNAIKYLDSQRPGQIKISGKTQDGSCIYCIEDNGIGIPDNHQDRVFEIFHRLDPTGPIAGEGLGLSIARRLLEAQNGSLYLSSEPGKGSRFFVKLPAPKKH